MKLDGASVQIYFMGSVASLGEPVCGVGVKFSGNTPVLDRRTAATLGVYRTRRDNFFYENRDV